MYINSYLILEIYYFILLVNMNYNEKVDSEILHSRVSIGLLRLNKY